MTVSRITRLAAAYVLAALIPVSILNAAPPADLDLHQAALSEAQLTVLIAESRQLDPFGNRSVEWWGNLEHQLAASLTSRIDDVRHQALVLTITFAVRYPERMDLRRAVPPLAYMYAKEEDERHRVMALSALHAIGGTFSMQLLAEAAGSQTSARVRQLTNAALAEYRAAR